MDKNTNIDKEHAKSNCYIITFVSTFFKRLLDIVIGFIGTIFLVPLTVIVYIIKLKNKENGPIFYEQLRIGKNGKVFRMHKYRSMIVGADDALEEYLLNHPEEAKEYETSKKLKNDPRITKTGKFLRKTSLDEWPQFIEVLFGKMSLVGPRPYLPREKEDMGKYYDKIICVKPGLTGPWQVSGRSNLSFEERLKIEEEYAKDHGFIKDVKILLKTVTQVFRKEGAI